MENRNMMLITSLAKACLTPTFQKICIRRYLERELFAWCIVKQKFSTRKITIKLLKLNKKGYYFLKKI